MIDLLYMMSQAKLAEYYDTRIDLPMRKYVLIANMLRKTTLQEEDKAEEQWLDTCLDALDKQDEEIQDDVKKQAITLQHFTFKAHQGNQQKLQLATQQQQSTYLPHDINQDYQNQQQQQDVTIYRIVLS